MQVLHETNGITFAKLDDMNLVVFQNRSKMAYFDNHLSAINAYGRAVVKVARSGQSVATYVERYSVACQGASDALLKMYYSEEVDTNED